MASGSYLFSAVSFFFSNAPSRNIRIIIKNVCELKSQLSGVVGCKCSSRSLKSKKKKDIFVEQIYE